MAVGIKEFLLERIAEDEAVAKTAIERSAREYYWADPKHPGASGVWHSVCDHDYQHEPETFYNVRIDGHPEGMTGCLDCLRAYLHMDYAIHIARFDPARILAEVEAKRALMEGHADGSHICVDNYMTADNECDHMLYLAAPYSSHPDYDPDWAVA